MSIGVTESEPRFVTYAVLPSGVIAMSVGCVPAAIGGAAVFVAVSIGVTESEPKFATYAVSPSGVIATPTGSDPTAIGVPAVFVAVSIGTTWPASVVVTYAVCARAPGGASRSIASSATSRTSDRRCAAPRPLTTDADIHRAYGLDRREPQAHAPG